MSDWSSYVCSSDLSVGTPGEAPASSVLHPLVHENVSTLQQARFTTLLTGAEFFLADHRMQGQKILPGVAYLEMVRAAIAHATDDERQPQAALGLREFGRESGGERGCQYV